MRTNETNEISTTQPLTDRKPDGFVGGVVKSLQVDPQPLNNYAYAAFLMGVASGIALSRFVGEPQQGTYLFTAITALVASLASIMATMVFVASNEQRLRYSASMLFFFAQGLTVTAACRYALAMQDDTAFKPRQ